MQLFIAEKPSMASAIAEVIGINKRGNGFIEAKNNTIVTWCFGHLLKQAMPDEYLPNTPVNPKTGKKVWRMEDLPVIPSKWKLQTDKSSVKQFNIIKKLLLEVSAKDTVVNAGDPDREGQLLVDEILNHLNYKGKSLRLWVQALDRENIEKALKNLKDNVSYLSFMQSALGRSRADWLVGLNLTRAYTIKSKRLVSVGRVQTPTLNLVVQRDILIENFKPKDYFTVWADVKHVNGRFKALLETEKLESGTDEENRLINSEIADKITQTVKGKQGKIIEAKKEKKSLDPPMPFMLSSLQKYASGAWGWSAKKTLDELQALYEKKLTSYPRTDCPYLSEEDFINAKTVLTKLKGVISLPEDINYSIKHKCWNTKKITAHTGIVPTKDISACGSLGADGKKLYERIVLSFYLIFMPPYEYNSVSVKLKIEDYIFGASEAQTLKPGFKSVLKDKAEQNENPPLPDLKQGDAVACADAGYEAKKTAPPPHFTDGTLVDAMSHIYKYIDDTEAKKVLKETDGIGTEATRANIMEELVNRDYLNRKGKQIISTSLGREIIKNLPDSVKDPVLTARWESGLSDIASKNLSLNDFLNIQAKFVQEELSRVKNSDIKITAQFQSPSGNRSSAKSKKSGKPCPSCKSDLVLLKTKTGKPYFRCFQCKSCFWPDNKNNPAAKWICYNWFMKIVGKRIIEKEITFEPRGDYLKEIATWNDTIGEIRFFPKGVYRYKTHEEADEHYLNCMASKIAENELKNYERSTKSNDR